VAVCISILSCTPIISMLLSLLTHIALLKTSPREMAPNEAGRERTSVRAKSRSVLGCPLNGLDPCNDNGDADACAENQGDVEKNGWYA